MATNKTQNLKLNSWVGTDGVRREEMNENFQKIDTKIGSVDAQLAETMKDYYQLINYLKSGNATKVTLYGDSITAGVGATGYGLSTTETIMTDSGGTTYYEPLNTSASWANHLRKWLENEHPSVTFKNRGIGGKSAKWANIEKALWVNDNEDITFVQLGTNDRWDSPTINDFKNDLTSFLNYVKQRSNLMIVMSAPPAQEYMPDGTLKSPYLRDMREINKAITEVCKQNGFVFFSHFDLFFDYITASGASFDFLLETILEGGSHPKDPGYELMWRNIQSKLHLKDSYKTWEGLLGDNLYRIRNSDKVSSSTPATNPVFIPGKTCVFEIGSSHPDLVNFPGGLAANGGEYRVYKGFLNDLYTYRTYRIRQSKSVFISYWDFSGNNWSAWDEIPSFVPKRETITVSNINVTANARAVSSAVITKFTLNASRVYAVAPQTAPPQGIIMNWRIDTGNNAIQLMFYNITGSPVTVSSFSINVSEVISQ